MGVLEAGKNFLRQRFIVETKEAARDVVAAPIGGIIDTTRSAADTVLAKPLTEVFPSVTPLVTQPLLRLGRATKNLLTLRPLKAAAEIATGALVDIPWHAANAVQTISNWVLNGVRNIIPTIGRAVIGASTATDIQRLGTTPYTTTLELPVAFGATSPPAGAPIIWPPGGASGLAPAAPGAHH